MKNLFLIFIFALTPSGIKATGPDPENELIAFSGMNRSQLTLSENDPKIDSIVIYNNPTEVDSLLYSKIEYYYGNNKKFEASYYWDDENSQWLLSKKQVDSLDSEKRVISTINYIAQNNTWIFYTRNEFTYSSGKKTASVFYEWNSAENKWDEGWKYEYKYNTQGNLYQESYFGNYSQDEIKWLITFKTDYQYDADGRLRYQFDSVASGGTDFLPEYKSEFFFDADGRTSLCLTYHWTDNSWENMNKQEYTYNKDDILIGIIKYNYKNADSSWINDTRHQYDFDNAGNQVLDYESVWDSTLPSWRGYKVYEWQYNNYNDLTINLSRTYDIDLKLWSGSKHVFKYGLYRNIIYSLDYTWNNELYDFEFYSKSFYYYSGKFNGIGTPSADFGVIVFPNPCSNRLIVKITGFTDSDQLIHGIVVDLSGREVIRFDEVSANKQIELNTTSLQRGYYILRIQTGEEFQMIRFLKD